MRRKLTAAISILMLMLFAAGCSPENTRNETMQADATDASALQNTTDALDVSSPENETVRDFALDQVLETDNLEDIHFNISVPEDYDRTHSYALHIALPVESISWLDAILFANAKSADAGLTPAYTVTGSGVVWDRDANGYRLPTEAEWEFACRGGTMTPFNTQTSISTREANYWGSYPYEIEENYFNTAALETEPSSYEGKPVSVGRYPPNAFGLYDMHGNVNEWCWDNYGPYDTDAATDPTGAASGTRHVYRGGGWNDFAKNLRSAYRGAGQSDLQYGNLGVRLVRNADTAGKGTVTALETTDIPAQTGKILIVFYSWSGNTRGIAREIRRQTGADLFEITLVHPYSADYNTVLMQAQEDQHIQARPEIADHIDNFDDYDTILLGYPNWWASIPMPIASFLEEYDLSGKTIIPFCSHGGGRFGQSLTAIAKLAPDANMGIGLAIHYSGGASMPQDVSAWLDANGIVQK